MKRIFKAFTLVILTTMVINLTGVDTAKSEAEAPKSTKEKLADSVILYVGSSQAFINNAETQVDASNPDVMPVVKDSRTLVPLRFISESIGAKVDWNEATSTITIAYDTKTIKLVVGSKSMSIDGSDVELDVAAEVINDRTFVPLRKLSEALGKKVFYDRGLIIIGNDENIFNPQTDKEKIDEVIAKVNSLPVVGTKENLEKLLKGNSDEGWAYSYAGDVVNSTADGAVEESKPMVTENKSNTTRTINAKQKAAKMDEASSTGAGSSNDFSTTNVQVEGVDEADIVKTDGKYLYQVNKRRIVVAEAYPADNMSVKSILNFDDTNFNPQEMYLHNDKLIVIGQTYKYNNPEVYYNDSNKESAKSILPRRNNMQIVKAIIYDTQNKEKLKVLREIEIEGNYVDSRKIGSSMYLENNRYMNYYIMKNNEAGSAPSYKDTNIKNEYNEVDLKDVRYFPNMAETNYMVIAGFDIDKADDKVNVNTYLGSGQNIYMSLENLYVAMSNSMRPQLRIAGDVKSMASKKIARPQYSEPGTLVYKFSLNKSSMTYLNKGEVPGNILNQFSMDESNGYFRIATTTYSDKMANNLYVLDDTMNVAGKIEDIAPGERIYSVRFMGDRGYMVTFKTVDPLFVIDLKDPKNPKILGALKIPGFSDYLHPYDENHIIGFGKDTVELSNNGVVGGTTAFYQGMKLAIFDVSDVANPKQMFTEYIGDRGTDSELLRNHKALLFSKSKNLLAFPVSVAEVKESEKKQKSGVPAYGQFVFQGAYVYNIDLEKGFTLKDTISHMTQDDYLKSGYQSYDNDKYVSRILYINDTLYTLSNGIYKAHNLGNMKEIKEISIP